MFLVTLLNWPPSYSSKDAPRGPCICHPLISSQLSHCFSPFILFLQRVVSVKAQTIHLLSKKKSKSKRKKKSELCRNLKPLFEDSKHNLSGTIRPTSECVQYIPLVLVPIIKLCSPSPYIMIITSQNNLHLCIYLYCTICWWYPHKGNLQIFVLIL